MDRASAKGEKGVVGGILVGPSVGWGSRVFQRLTIMLVTAVSVVFTEQRAAQRALRGGPRICRATLTASLTRMIPLATP